MLAEVKGLSVPVTVSVTGATLSVTVWTFVVAGSLSVAVVVRFTDIEAIVVCCTVAVDGRGAMARTTLVEVVVDGGAATTRAVEGSPGTVVVVFTAPDSIMVVTVFVCATPLTVVVTRIVVVMADCPFASPVAAGTARTVLVVVLDSAFGAG